MKKRILFLGIIFSVVCLTCVVLISVKVKKAAAKAEAERIARVEEFKKQNLVWLNSTLDVETEFEILKASYPDIKFDLTWDSEVKDWKITVISYNKSHEFYWCNGKYLPYEEIENQARYWNVISVYDSKVPDPDEFTEEDLQEIYDFCSGRDSGEISSKEIFNAIYDSPDEPTTKKYIKRIKFLGKKVEVHKYIIPALKRIEKKILKLSKTDAQVKQFIKDLDSVGAFNWREIRDAKTKSFHSYGIAIDILPNDWRNTIIYWGFEKQDGNEEWMMIPLKDRWAPPKEVIKFFEDEGFIWGGTWTVWDNMHFEYHPEQIRDYSK